MEMLMSQFLKYNLNKKGASSPPWILVLRSSYTHKLNNIPFVTSILSLIFMLVVIQAVSSIVHAETTNVGAIINLDSRMGTEQRLAIQIAVEDLNNANHNLSVHYINSNKGSPLQTAFAAKKLIKEAHVQVILVCMDDWQATALVAQVGSKAKVPVLSLVASAPITVPFPSLQWPFLVQMAHNATQQISYITSIIQAYNWHRITLVYEVDSNGGDSGSFSVLNEALQGIGSQIECKLYLPSFSSDMDSTKIVKDAIGNLLNEKCYSRVFVVHKVSLPYVNRLFKEAKAAGLMGNDSAWITTEAITNYFPSLNDTTMLSMEGVLGIMTAVDNSTLSYQKFEAQFETRVNDMDSYNGPSFRALLAYDAVTTISKAIGSLRNTSDSTRYTSKDFLKEILRVNFTGLTDHVHFDQDRSMLEQSFANILVNIIGTSYTEVLDLARDDVEDDGTAKALASRVTWPGKLNGLNVIPKGWTMPSYKKKMQLGVPVAHMYKNFIDYEGGKQCDPPKNGSVPVGHNESYTGFSIELFKEVRDYLGYDLPYDFIPYCGSYDDLVYSVYNKTFDGAIGDMTVLSNRSELVDFTLPYQESGLVIVFPTVESYNSRGVWIFLAPFTPIMWLVSVGVFIYTMFIIWALEHGNNSEIIKGSRKDQINGTIWFAFNSLYFAQSDKISSTLAKVVVIMWLFIVLVITQSYTANLSSMLTNDLLNQNTVDAEMLKRTNAKVGYDSSTFVKVFLEDLLQYDPENIIGIDKGDFEGFHKRFQTRNITAAFLEVAYAKLFLSQYCNKYTMTMPVYGYGGLGYVFPKGSPIANDVSQAILNLTETRAIEKLEVHWLNTGSKCTYASDDPTTSLTKGGPSSLSLHSFWVLFLISCATASICLVASLVSSISKRVIPSQNMVVDHIPYSNRAPVDLALGGPREIQIY